MAAELRKWRAQQSRYFADPDAVPPPDVRAAIAEASTVRNNRLSCYNCFGEGHVAASCPHSGVFCSSCGDRGHKPDDCPIYFMELSIRGSLAAFLQQRREEIARALVKGADKGRFPALDPGSCVQRSDKANDNSNSNRSDKSNLRKSKSGTDYSAIQCVVCGKLGHANCGAPPLNHWTPYCPRCAHVGHTAAGCTGGAGFFGSCRPSLLEQMEAADPWKYASQRGWGRANNNKCGKKPSFGSQLRKPKSTWQKHRKASTAKAMAADPWHPGHLR